jgi:hypothetical protein
MSNLNNRKSVDPRWTRWALKTLDGFATCIVAIYDPNISDDGVTFNPYGPPTTAEPTMLWQGPGQLQVFRQTLNADDVAGSITQIRSIRFTVPLDGPQVPVRKGLIVRVISCEHDPSTTEYEYTVTSGINSGLAWKRTIEAETDQSVFVTPIGG